MPEDGFLEVSRATIMEEEGVAADGFRQADAPERRRAPFGAGGNAHDLTVGKAAEEAGATITGFIRLEVGEGIEKKEEDFAEEVKAAAGI